MGVEVECLCDAAGGMVDLEFWEGVKILWVNTYHISYMSKCFTTRNGGH